MKLLAFSVHDSKVEAFIKPFFDVTTGSAIRAFSDAVNEEGSQFHRHAADYTLFHVGEFDQEMGRLLPMEPKSLGNAVTYLHGDTEISPIQLEHEGLQA